MLGYTTNPLGKPCQIPAPFLPFPLPLPSVSSSPQTEAPTWEFKVHHHLMMQRALRKPVRVASAYTSLLSPGELVQFKKKKKSKTEEEAGMRCGIWVEEGKMCFRNSVGNGCPLILNSPPKKRSPLDLSGWGLITWMLWFAFKGCSWNIWGGGVENRQIYTQTHKNKFHPSILPSIHLSFHPSIHLIGHGFSLATSLNSISLPRLSVTIPRSGRYFYMSTACMEILKGN